MKKLVWTIALLVTLINISLSAYFYINLKTAALETGQLEQSLTTDSLVNLDYLSLSSVQKQGTMFMVSIPDTVLSDKSVQFLKSNKISGVILMPDNIENEAQVKQLTLDLKTKVDDRLLIAIDQEGGTVVRIPWDKYARTSARTLGNVNKTQDTYEIAKYRAQLLKDLGINLILGPVADVADSNSFMYSRSYSNSPQIVASHVEAEIKAYHELALLTAVKHFPGHGDTTTDSYQEFPYISKSIEELQVNEFIPFQKAIEMQTDFVMTGHIVNSQIDSAPASICEKYAAILEEDLGFEGIIITDDLKMTGDIDGGINWGINLLIENQSAIQNRLSLIEPEEKYVKKVLELRYEKL
ncbi:beta-hexosaminidase [Candidatus Dojkabacteria bacterium]|nr:beta-hexosaminidase [Candidatus Dojkabacteria bacterium]